MSLSKEACDRAISPYRAEAITAIVLSALSLESFVNEFAHNINENPPEKQHDKLAMLGLLLVEIEKNRGSLTSRVDLIHLCLSNRKPVYGALVYQDFKTLITLRNKLVHSKPIVYADNQESNHVHPAFMAHLKNRKVVDIDEAKENSSWRSLIQNQKTAKWAYNTAVNLIKDIGNIIPACYRSKYIIDDRLLINLPPE